MNISVKTPQDIERMRVAGRLAAEVLQVVAPHVIPPTPTTREPDQNSYARNAPAILIPEGSTRRQPRSGRR